MNVTITGRCLCGGVHYAYTGELGPAAYCHCLDCRRCTGSAFNVSVRLAADGFAITGGSPKGFTKADDSGQELTRHFCPDCGSPIFTSSPGHGRHVYVKAGSMDDPTLVKPHHQAWTASQVAWAHIDDGLTSYAKGRA
jgi:hypothetical protein